MSINAENKSLELSNNLVNDVVKDQGGNIWILLLLMPASVANHILFSASSCIARTLLCESELGKSVCLYQ